MALMEFHISRAARDRYHTDRALFSFTGNVIFADLKASRELAHNMNVVRGTEQGPERVVNPGALFAMGLIDEARHLLIDHYRKSVAPTQITIPNPFLKAENAEGREAGFDFQPLDWVQVKGTWYVGTGNKWDKDATIGVKAGGAVTHFGKEVHYDGAKDEEVVVIIMGEGPATNIPVEMAQ